MKKLKKVAYMGLCAMMIVPIAACGTNGPTQKELAEKQAGAYMDSALTTLQNAKSFKLTFVEKETNAYEYFGEESNVIDPELNYSDSEQTTTEITIAEDGEGIAMHYVSTYESKSEDYTYVYVEETIYKGEYAYTRSYEVSEEETEPSYWVKIEGESSSNKIMMLPVDVIPKILKTKEVEDAARKLLDKLEDAVVEEILAGKATNGNVVIDYDYKEYVKGWIDYFNSVDETKTTLGSVVNKVLSEVSSGLTVEAILGQLSAYSKMTVADALTSLDALLANKYDTSLQAIKDAIVNSEVMGVIFEDLMKLDAAAIAEAKAWKFESLKTGEYGSRIVSDVINEYLMTSGLVPTPEDGEDPVDYVEQFLTSATAALGKTLAELGMNMDSYDGMEIKSFGGNTALTFDSANALKEWSVYFGSEITEKEYEYETVDEVEVATHIGYETTKSEMTFTVSDISSSAVTINAPAEDEILKLVALSGYFDEAETLRVNSSIDGVDGYLEIYNEEGQFLYYVYFETAEILEEYGQTLTVTVTDAAGWNGAVLGSMMTPTWTYFEENTAEFELTLNEDGTYSVSGFPTQDEINEWYNTVYLLSQNF